MAREMTAEEKRAVRRVQRAVADLPTTLWLYCHGDYTTVLDCDQDGQPLRDGDDFDRDAVLGGFDSKRCSAGDW